MRRISSALLACSTLALIATGCSRSPAESFTSIGFRGMRVVFVSDSADVNIKDLSERVQKVPAMPRTSAPEVAIRQIVGNSLYGWGEDCGSHYIAKRVTWDPRMGLAHATDGWNVGDAAVLRSYIRTTNTDYIVVLNKVSVRRGDVAKTGDGNNAKLSFADVSLDLSIIDAKTAKRVWRSPAQARTEASDSLEQMVPQALDLAVDNFFVSLPEVRRWGCRNVGDRFQ
ncbi:MAG: hypothetical protein RL173_1643 [Fibrobacterota bacterium]|jgi:hypothetical protein